MKEITFEEALHLKEPVFVDLRTSAEYQEGTIPGAINVPLFNEAEREELGITYANICPKKALLRGVEFGANKIADIIKTIDKLAEKGNIVLFCQRGGMRSQSLYQIANLLKISVYRLQGGYKEFRQYVIGFLNNYQLPCPLVTLYGLAGASKTKILNLLQENKLSTIDLEALAGHRGSVFGEMGLAKATGQKQFDALLWSELKKISSPRCIIIEGESKRLGNVYLPSFLIDQRQKGLNIYIDTPLQKRVEHITHDYLDDMDNMALLSESIRGLSKIKEHLIKLMGKAYYIHLEELLHKGNYKQFITEILEKYYDPLYLASMKNISFNLKIEMVNEFDTASKIKTYLETVT